MSEKAVTDSLVTLMSFVKDQTKTNLAEQGRKMNLNVEDIRKLSVVIEASITNAFMRGMDSVIKESSSKKKK